jgi:carboxymethylenebutenolidase
MVKTAPVAGSAWARRLLISLTALALLAAPARAESVKVTHDKFVVQGKTIAVDRFEPTAKGKYPAVVLSHDSTGLKNLSFYRWCGRVLAEEGYVVVLVHYFDATGHKKVDPKTVKEADFKTWLTTVRKAVAYARKLPGVDSQRVGLLGFSLGAYLSLTLAADKDSQVAAVAEFFGGLPDCRWKDLKRLPPTLIVHGDQDTTVSVKEAYALRGFLEAKKLPYAIKIYEGQEHLFGGKVTFPVKRVIIEDAKRRTLAFFEKYLKKAAVTIAPVPKRLAGNEK